MRARHIVLVGLISLTVGCSGGGQPEGAASPSHGGISLSEARSKGVLYADYDAVFRQPKAGPNGTYTLVITNVGKKADTYTITIQPATAGTVSPSTAQASPGSAIELTVTLTAAGSVRVFSSGRGAEIADVSLAPR